MDRHLNRVVGMTRNADPVWLAAQNPAAFMDDIQTRLSDLHHAIVEGYFYN